jgi:lipoyl(octanoyl) transferase
MGSHRSLTTAWLGQIEYRSALDLQNALVARRQHDEIDDVLLLLEHPHVFTLGRGGDERFVLNADGTPVYRVSRGGQVTYHGPGQLIGYAIVKLEGAERDVIRYLRLLEQVLIDALGQLDIGATRRAGLTGVWVAEKKIASIGVGFRRWVSLHGFALNVTTDLSFFERIVPCGIAECRMTSMAAEGARTILTRSVAGIVEREFAKLANYERITAVAPSNLQAPIDSATHACEARELQSLKI